MKIQIHIVACLFALVGFSSTSKAQITITAADASAVNAVGTVIINHVIH